MSDVDFQHDIVEIVYDIKVWQKKILKHNQVVFIICLFR